MKIFSLVRNLQRPVEQDCIRPAFAVRSHICNHTENLELVMERGHHGAFQFLRLIFREFLISRRAVIAFISVFSTSIFLDQEKVAILLF